MGTVTRPEGAFHANGREFRFGSGQPISWDEVRRVVARRVDHGFCATVFLRLDLQSGDAYEFDQELEGYALCASEIGRNLPGANPIWQTEMAHPSLAPNQMIVFERP